MMDQTKSLAGTDISMDDFHVCLKCQHAGRVVVKGSRKFSNTAAGFTAFLGWAKARVPAGNVLHVVMEATGVYHEELAYFLHTNQVQVSVILPSVIKSYGKSVNQRTKTDKTDAALIADYGMERDPPAWKPIEGDNLLGRQLCRELLSAKRNQTRCKNQLHAYRRTRGMSPVVIAIKEKQMQGIQETIGILETEITRLSREDSQISAKVDKLETIPGVSRITIMIILGETNRFEIFNSIRQVTSYAGLDIKERESGKLRGQAKISKKGNARIRECLYMPAMSACKWNKPIRELYERVVEKNPGIKRKGIVAGMRKLLTLMFTLWKKNEPYNEGYQWDKRMNSGNEEE